MNTINALIRLTLGILALVGACHLGTLYIDPAIAPVVNTAVCVILCLAGMGSFIIDEDEKEELNKDLDRFYALELGKITILGSKDIKKAESTPPKVEGKIINFTKKD